MRDCVSECRGRTELRRSIKPLALGLAVRRHLVNQHALRQEKEDWRQLGLLAEGELLSATARKEDP